MSWQRHPLHEGLAPWASEWDRLNRQLYGAHPLFDSRFVSGLLRHFGSGNEYLAMHVSGSDPDGMMILMPHRLGMHRTFLPAQAQVCPVLARSTDVLAEIFDDLGPSVIAVDWLCQDPRYSPFDNGAQEMRTRSLPHVTTMNIVLEGDFEAYWSERSKNLKSNMRRYRHRLEREGLEERTTTVTDPAEMLDAVRRYGALEATGWKARAGTAVAVDNAQGGFYTEILRAFAGTGQAAVYEYAVNGAVVASRMLVWNDDIMVILKTAYDESYAKLAPGRRLLYRILEREFEQSPGKSLEFYTNASRDQLSWATGTREVRHVTGYRNRAAFVAHDCFWRMKRLLSRPKRRMTMSERRRILMIAYHFPPLAGSSGIQRTLRFARCLPEFGWEPIVLTAHPRAYARTSDDQLADVPDGLPVIRAPAWDTARHLSIAGRYPAMFARPDRWASWWLGAVPAALRAIRHFHPEAVWSTYPIATAHRIGATVARRSGLPWMADFRDPMAQEGYPADPATWRSFDRIERRTVGSARLSTFTTPGAAAMYRERYPDAADRIEVLENGYAEESFAGIQPSQAPLAEGRLTLVHSGVVYPEERDPTRLFAALERLRREAPDTFGRLLIRFRAPVQDELLRDLARRHEVQDAIEVLPAIGYRDALEEMLRADGLLVLQASNCNQQIPAKLYEYLRARRPIIALTDPAGDTAAVARAAGIDTIAPLDDDAAIAGLLRRFLDSPESAPLPKRRGGQAAPRAAGAPSSSRDCWSA
ncbi:MAG: GNAT family N-acetyltransferase [Halofilum sp. (in: g-proteobacteria)]|nr:GNAT family N-acetyltransferase [Halofilum sp. (in: g-proteobacteria)]